MENNNDYFLQRNINLNRQIKALKAQLPPFCNEFLLGIESRTSALTRLAYARDLKLFFEFLTTEIYEFSGVEMKSLNLNELELVTATHIEEYLSFLNAYNLTGKTKTNSATAKARKLCAIRAMFKYFFKKDKLSKNITEKISSPKIHEKEIIRLEVDEVVKILNEAENGTNLTANQQSFHKHTAKRDTAILTLFLGTGIRISELVGLNVDDIDFSANAFTITRKGGNRVILYFSDEVRIALLNYLDERNNDKEISTDEKALFLSLRKSRIGVRAVEKLVKKYSLVTTPLKKITPHKLRSTYGTNLYKETNDIYIVADVLGHKDVNTTKKHYAAMSDDIRRNAANKVKLR